MCPSSPKVRITLDNGPNRCSVSEISGFLAGADLSTGLFLGREDFRSVEPVLSRYIIRWQLQEYYQQECKGYERLNDVLIVFGDGMNARCLTCEEYCKYKSPGVSEISKGILEIINFAATVTGAGERRTTYYPFNATWIEFSVKVFDMESTRESTDNANSLSHTHTHLSITTNLPWLLRRNIDTLLTSLAAALRPTPEPGIAISEARMQRDDGAITLSLLPLDLVVQEACWHPLFPRKVISREALTREEGFLGLDISFDWMIALCGTDVAMLEQGGFCLEGVYTSLIPIKLKERRHVQWHLFCVDQGKRESSDFRRNLWNVHMPKDWYNDRRSRYSSWGTKYNPLHWLVRKLCDNRGHTLTKWSSCQRVQRACREDREDPF